MHLIRKRLYISGCHNKFTLLKKKKWDGTRDYLYFGNILSRKKKILKIIENNFCKTFAEHVAHLHAADFKKKARFTFWFKFNKYTLNKVHQYRGVSKQFGVSQKEKIAFRENVKIKPVLFTPRCWIIDRAHSMSKSLNFEPVKGV